MKTDVLLTPPPDSIESAFTDRYFRKHLRAEIEQIAGRNGVILKDGQKYKRTPYDTLIETDIMNVSGIIAEYMRIRQKTSSLPHGCRSVLSGMVAHAISRMYDTYSKINCMT
jgi:hypothetical protein